MIVEYDGRHHVERIEQWESDLDRREEIDDEGWRILVVVAAGIYTDPSRTVDRIFRLLRARGLEGLPERPSEDWRPHFPAGLRPELAPVRVEVHRGGGESTPAAP